MLIETFQKRSFLKQKGDLLWTDRKRELGRIWDYEDFRYAYEWMRGQYERRCHCQLSPKQALIWGFGSPLLQDDYHDGDKRVASVRLWVEVPDELALVSSFEVWHFVLGRHYFHDELEHSGVSMEKDWEILFDQQQLKKRGFLKSNDDVQVVFPWIDRSWIRRVRYFRGEF